MTTHPACGLASTPSANFVRELGDLPDENLTEYRIETARDVKVSSNNLEYADLRRERDRKPDCQPPTLSAMLLPFESWSMIIQTVNGTHLNPAFASFSSEIQF